jgi:prolyl-tRNA synthetase
VAAAIEQNSDERGIVFPLAIAPFQVAIVPIGASKNAEVHRVAEELHDNLSAAGIDVLLDDRDERPGVMFADMDLIGVPFRIVVGDRGLKTGVVEFKSRREDKAANVAVAEVVDYTRGRIVASV